MAAHARGLELHERYSRAHAGVKLEHSKKRAGGVNRRPFQTHLPYPPHPPYGERSEPP